jgi:TPR repeat protein
LWSAVEKGNTAAEIDLAELFRTGRGVAKNCDQARILLSAAARKGSAEARKRAESLQRQGCGN